MADHYFIQSRESLVPIISMSALGAVQHWTHASHHSHETFPRNVQRRYTLHQQPVFKQLKLDADTVQ